MKRILLSATALILAASLHAQGDDAASFAEKGKLYARVALGSMHQLNPIAQDVYYEPLLSPGANFTQFQFLQFSYFFSDHLGIEINVPFHINQLRSSDIDGMVASYIAAQAPGFEHYDFDRAAPRPAFEAYQASLALVYRKSWEQWSFNAGLGLGVAFLNIYQRHFSIKEIGSHRIDVVNLTADDVSPLFFSLSTNFALGYRISERFELSLESNIWMHQYAYGIDEIRTDRLTNAQETRRFEDDQWMVALGWSVGGRMMIFKKAKAK